ncbi:GNAT family N-acetyltransferase [Deinococcus cellulosilyticus]|uniref:N-acetyltransferase GCN5 n=1 Tax=Deinococcus cellulosilyticus (strain DSM 18568 / NBRC 106333 / KACC 11606 / 5516J-15) TaxID=1223518 RepID=A0A511N5V7_DEIC1|nr:GNAT family N-acetyltransferase [Deinococcus cellulosilyticus]GEM48242.1 N-acetyltransferase GCN5 [Deinococcus cellulosilyticus NBRC 106333 = KACC 11606]
MPERFRVVQSTPDMAHRLAEIQRACFPDLAEGELMRAEHYLSHQKVFPEGQHAVLDEETGQVAASSSDLRMNVDFEHFEHRYMDAVDNNYLTNHNPAGEWLYGADIAVHPEYRGHGLSTLLYNARHDLIRRLGLKGHVAGAMPKGYHLHPDLSIEEYVQKVVAGELRDPVLSVQLKRGYQVHGIIPDYLEDPSCGHYGVFIVWHNPEVSQ